MIVAMFFTCDESNLIYFFNYFMFVNIQGKQHKMLKKRPIITWHNFSDDLNNAISFISICIRPSVQLLF